MEGQKIRDLAVRFAVVLAVILVFGAFDYVAHSSSDEYSVPPRYFRNKIIFGTLYGFIAYVLARRLPLFRRAFVFSLVVSILLQIRYFLEGYALDFVILFLGIHFLILLPTAYLAFGMADGHGLTRTATTPEEKPHVCSASHAFFLASSPRRLLQNPRKILEGLVAEGETVLDVGCGPGVFTTALAEMVGDRGRVIAADLQEEMLAMVGKNAEKMGLGERIRLHKTGVDRIGVAEQVDFVLAFYMIHEVPDRERFFKELSTILKPGGRFLLVEPMFHVSKAAYKDTLEKAEKAGLTPLRPVKVFFSRGTLFRKS